MILFFFFLFCILHSFHIGVQMSGERNLGPQLAQITEKVFPDMCWCPGLYPCPAQCVCPWHSAEQGEMKELLFWCQSQMPTTTNQPTNQHHPPTSPPAFPSDTVRTGALHRAAGGPINRQSMSVELHRSVNRAGCS